MSEQIESAAALMVRDYLILTFLVSLGALQITVSISGIRGLWLTSNRAFNRVVGVMLIVSGLCFYIFSPIWIEGPWAAGSVVDGTSEGRVWGTAALNEISGARNLNDIHGGMAGTAYAVFFLLSAVLATLFAAIIGAINMRILRSRDQIGESSPSSARLDGLDALSHTDAVSAMFASLENLRAEGFRDALSQMKSGRRWKIPRRIAGIWRD